MTPYDKQLQQLYEDCVESCADSMYRVAYRLTGNQTLAVELVQETYLNAWTNLSSLKDTDKLRGWMFAILRNQYSKLIRKESKAATTTEHLDQTAQQEQNNSSEIATTVQIAMDLLDDKHKLPLLLVSMEGMSVEEAAKALDIPRGTVLSRLSRGREKLKELLLRQGYVA